MTITDMTLGWPGVYPSWLTEFRPHQLTAAREIVNLFESGVDVVMLDAPVGSGKTIVAEMVRQYLGVKGTYVCSGLDLQDQFIGDFGEYSRVLKGRRNYPTLKLPMSMVTAADCKMKACTYCEPKADCPYIKARQGAGAADVAVLNTSYMMAFRGDTYIRPLIVVDECDQIEGALMGYYEFTVTARRMGLLGIDGPVKAARKVTLQKWLLETFVPAVDEWMAAMGVPDEDDVQGARLFESMKMDRAKAVDVAGQLEDDWVRDYSTWHGHEQDLILKPVTVWRQGGDVLWKRGKKKGVKWLCMSGTIISPEAWAVDVGVEEAGLTWGVVSVPMMFDVANRPVVLKPVADMSRAGGPGEIEKLISTITLLLDRHEGESMLIHTVSYGLMKEVVAGLRRAGVQGVISYETSGDRELALRRFKSERGVLVAPSMDRGVDLPDDLCRVVVVAKMPFAYLGDRQVSERMRLPGGQTWYDIATTRTLVQMTGRGVRHEEDWCVTYILDRQFQRYYGKQGRRLLPRWWQDSLKGDT